MVGNGSDTTRTVPGGFGHADPTRVNESTVTVVSVKTVLAPGADRRVCDVIAAALPAPWDRTATAIEFDGSAVRILIPWAIGGSSDVAAILRRALLAELDYLLPVSIETDPESKRKWADEVIHNPSDIAEGDVLAIRHEPWLVADARLATEDEIAEAGRWTDAQIDEFGPVWNLRLIGVWCGVGDDLLLTAMQIRRSVRRLDPSGRWPECSECGKLWPCPDEIDAKPSVAAPSAQTRQR